MSALMLGFCKFTAEAMVAVIPLLCCNLLLPGHREVSRDAWQEDDRSEKPDFLIMSSRWPDVDVGCGHGS